MKVKCSTCRGTGIDIFDGGICLDGCDGTGILEKSRFSIWRDNRFRVKHGEKKLERV